MVGGGFFFISFQHQKEDAPVLNASMAPIERVNPKDNRRSETSKYWLGSDGGLRISCNGKRVRSRRVSFKILTLL